MVNQTPSRNRRRFDLRPPRSPKGARRRDLLFNRLLRWASRDTPTVEAGENIALIGVLTGEAARPHRTHNRGKQNPPSALCCLVNRWEKAELVHGMGPATTALSTGSKLGFRVSNGCGRSKEWPTQLKAGRSDGVSKVVASVAVFAGLSGRQDLIGLLLVDLLARLSESLN